VLLAGAVAAQPASDGRAAALELELELARSRELYLLVDPGGRQFQVRARGIVLESVAMVDVVVRSMAPLLAGGDPPRLEVPAVWHVTQAPEDTWRRVIAPPTLRPYADEEEEDPTPWPTGAGPKPTRTPTPTPVMVPPDYDLKLDSGWRLEVASERPGFYGSRLGGAIASGWLRLLGRQREDQPPRLVLVMAPDDARRIRHLFVPGTAVLLAQARSSPES
jgi:hypothetical protein